MPNKKQNNEPKRFGMGSSKPPMTFDQAMDVILDPAIKRASRKAKPERKTPKK